MIPTHEDYDRMGGGPFVTLTTGDYSVPKNSHVTECLILGDIEDDISESSQTFTILYSTSRPMSAIADRYRESEESLDFTTTLRIIFQAIARQHYDNAFPLFSCGAIEQDLATIYSDVNFLFCPSSGCTLGQCVEELPNLVEHLVRLDVRDFDRKRSQLTVQVTERRIERGLPRYTLSVESTAYPRIPVSVDIRVGEYPDIPDQDMYIMRAYCGNLAQTEFLFAVKIWARKRSVVNPRNGGFSSFALVLVAIELFKERGDVNFPSYLDRLEETRRRGPYEEDALYIANPPDVPGNAASGVTETYWTTLIQPEIDRARDIIRFLPHAAELSEVLEAIIRTESR